MAADGTTRGAPAAAGVGCAGGNPLQDIPWIETSSSEYESKRETYNLDNPATPYAIASPRNARDVAALVRYSIDSGIPFTVRSGGHDLFGRSVAQSALCIDMRAIDFVEIAPDKNSARVGGGILFGKLIQELTLENLTTPFAAVPSIGYVGWASLGGYGGVSGQWGLGVDQIIGAEIVDAYGNIVQADEETLKGIKGAGGNFGVVVALRIKLYELKTLFAGLIVLDSSTKGVPQTFADFMSGIQSTQSAGRYPPQVVTQAIIVNHPQMGQTVLITFAWSSPNLSQGEKFLEKILAFAPVAMHNVKEMNVPAWLNLLDSFSPYGLFSSARGISFRQLSPNVLKIIGSNLKKMPSDPATLFVVHQLGRYSPSVTDANLRERSCFNPASRQGHYMLELVASVIDQKQFLKTQKWIKDMYEELKASGEAMDASYISLTHPEDISLEKVYGTEWENLVRLKERLDPQGVFANAVPRMSVG